MTDILLVDDHSLVREGISKLLARDADLRIVAETGDGLAVLPLLEATNPNMLIIDLLLPGLHGLEVLRCIQERFPWILTVVLSMHNAPHYVREAIRRGARAYVLKESATGVLLKAIHRVMEGQRFLDPDLHLDLSELEVLTQSHEDTSLDPSAFLTAREREVLQVTVEGSTIKETGARLGISPKTVERHRDSLMKKLGCRSQIELVRFAIAHGLIRTPGPDS